MDSLVSTEWLAAEIGAPDLVILDASLFLDARDAAGEYEAAHIPGAVFLDLPSLRDTAAPFPNTFPQAHRVASRLRSLGAGDASRIVVYDNSPLRSAARAWWLLRVAYGARRVAILDGGMQKWLAEGRATEGGRPDVRSGHFTPQLRDGALADKPFMLANLDSGGHQVADARSAGRFSGAEADPHGLASGHIPGSCSLHYARLLSPDGTYRSPDELRAAFAEAGIDLARPLVTTCGSGVTAAVLVFAAHLAGKDDVMLYDGSWSEWGSDPDTPKETA